MEEHYSLLGKALFPSSINATGVKCLQSLTKILLYQVPVFLKGNFFSKPRYHSIADACNTGSY